MICCPFHDWLFSCIADPGLTILQHLQIEFCKFISSTMQQSYFNINSIIILTPAPLPFSCLGQVCHELLIITKNPRTLMILIIFRTHRSPILIQVTSSWTGSYISSLPEKLDQVYFNCIKTLNAWTFEELKVGLNMKNRTYWRSMGNKRSQYIPHLGCTLHSTSKASRGEKWSMNINRCLLKRKSIFLII